MFDKSILEAQNCCIHTSLEKQKPHPYGKRLRIFECKSSGKFRLLAYNDCNEAVSCLLIDPDGLKRTYTVKAVFTLDGYRRKGYAKQLLAVARHLIGTVKHGNDFTNDGLLWRDSVEMIK